MKDIKKDIEECVSEYFKDIDEDVLVLFGEWVGDSEERGLNSPWSAAKAQSIA